MWHQCRRRACYRELQRSPVSGELAGHDAVVAVAVLFAFALLQWRGLISVFRLRSNKPEMARPYRAWGYPWTPGPALASSLVFLTGAAYTDRVNTPWALATLAASYPIFRVMKLFPRTIA